ncbi:hypothetical protein C8R44DRAFT_893634 [Mycena epipterygia]|nr:hypothetical protein C8R44DRAFT_893634 [Mycena epipterygia]
MPLVAAALTFGSFGDILEAAKIAKRIIDVLRKGGGSHERQKLISTLKAICDDMSWLTMLPEGHFITRLKDEVALCRSLLDNFHTKIKSYEGFLGRIWMVAVEEKELASWRAQISERHAALRDLLGPISIVQLHEVVQQLGRIETQVQHVGSRVNNVEAVGTLGVLMTTFLSTEVSLQQTIHKILPHDISDPYFYIRNPVGEHIPILLSAYRIFKDLDLILRANCNRPDVGSRYVEAGDYSILSTNGVIVLRLRLRGEVRAGIVFDMSIIQRKRMRPALQKCPHCGHTNANAVEVPIPHVGQDIKCPSPKGLKKSLLRKYCV